MKRNLFRYLSFSVLLVFIACSKQKMSPEEADRSMKVLNSNLVNLASAGAEKPEFKALKFLYGQNGVPLPFSRKSGVLTDTSVFRISTCKGEYEWNNHSKMFEKKRASESVVLFFQPDSLMKDSIRFELSDYQTQSYSSRPDFPVSGNIKIDHNREEVFQLNYSAAVQNNLPEKINSEAKGDGYELKFSQNRTQTGKTGELNLNFSLGNHGVKAISAEVKASIEYSRTSYFFKIIDFKLKLIDHHVLGRIDYGRINPTSNDYVDSFNSNSSIVLYEGSRIVGTVVLDRVENGEVLDYFIKFSNNEKVLLSKYIPVLNKLLNLKY